MTTRKLTTADLDTMTEDDRWLGFGYLGERRGLRLEAIEADGRRQADLIARVTRMDADVVDEANVEGLTYDELFAWANSKDGRWFADSYGTPHAADLLPSRSRLARYGVES